MMFVSTVLLAQDPSSEKAKDSIKTEVVEVITSYAPKVTDAFKIKRKPVITLSKDVEKKALNYQIISVPVASTFIPASGTLKGIDVGKKELLFDNYLSVGFGNNTTPFFEGFVHQNTPFDSEYGISLKFTSTSDPVENTELSSSFYNIDLDMFYKQEERYFDWKMGFNLQRNKYNWYGLPTNINYTEQAINAIEEEQTYKNYKVYGEIEFDDSYIKKGSASIGYFSDILDSSEINVDLNSSFAFPLGRFGLNLEDLQIGASLNYLSGSFAKSYNDVNEEINHSFITAGIHPSYDYVFYNFDIKIGAKAYFSMDTENSKNQFFVYPDIKVSYPIIPKFANLYVGASGDLHNNSFKSLSERNPYISPTINITQTSETYNLFGGLKGVLADNVNYNVKGGYKNEEAKPLYILNYSKSDDGIKTAETNGFLFKGYEYGNSFNVVYDNVKTVSFIGEINYDFSKQISLGLNGEFNTYSLENQQEAWNLPKIKGDIFGKYKTEKWYAGANIYFVGSRKGVLYDYDNDTIIPVDLESYVDVNLNGGYHFSDIFSVFLKANNITNNSYQKFTNFNTQGFQVLGGIIWKFDTLF
ncbi:hypothetical protein C7447_10384 [Tenacibaculum adriaticum]|uniref:TonB dependent receptor n=1 Tax=Tenacibaculum adriaticum TaxID=413713 RepID=A0A5S5DRA6_9FLAO|nr:hypothetical protein C7447_10384 [Tenacibaculum adriaticum]